MHYIADLLTTKHEDLNKKIIDVITDQLKLSKKFMNNEKNPQREGFNKLNLEHSNILITALLMENIQLL